VPVEQLVRNGIVLPYDDRRQDTLLIALRNNLALLNVLFLDLPVRAYRGRRQRESAPWGTGGAVPRSKVRSAGGDANARAPDGAGVRRRRASRSGGGTVRCRGLDGRGRIHVGRMRVGFPHRTWKPDHDNRRLGRCRSRTNRSEF